MRPTALLAILGCFCLSPILTEAATISIQKKVDLSLGTGSLFPSVETHTTLQAVTALLDGSYLVVTTVGDACRIELFSEHRVSQWTQTIPPEERTLTHTFEQTAEGRDGSFVLVTRMWASGFTSGSSLTRVSRQGDILTNVVFQNRSLTTVASLTNGFVVAGSTPNTSIINIYRLSPELSLMSTSILTSANWPANPPRMVHGCADGGYLVAGYVPTFSGGNVFGERLTKFQFDDTIEWHAWFNGNPLGTSFDALARIVSTDDGGFLLGYTADSAPGRNRSAPNLGESDYWLVRIDKQGQKLWDRSYGGSGGESLENIVPTSDGGFLLSGHSSSLQPSGNKSSEGIGGWLVKITRPGQIESELMVDDFASVVGNGDRLKVRSVNLGTNFIRVLDVTPVMVITASPSGTTPYRIDVSTDLTNWSPLVTGFQGRMQMRDPAEAMKFYRIRDL